MTDNSTVYDTKQSLFESLLYQLKEIEKQETKEIYFHDTIHEVVDNAITGLSKMENMQIIEDLESEIDNDWVDEGLIDNSSLERTLQTTAYCYLEQSLFEDDFIVERLQNTLNNETIDYKTAQQLIKEILKREEMSEYK